MQPLYIVGFLEIPKCFVARRKPGTVAQNVLCNLYVGATFSGICILPVNIVVWMDVDVCTCFFFVVVVAVVDCICIGLYVFLSKT